jgi:hypothetical protein
LVLPANVETLLERLVETPQKIETETENRPVSLSVSVSKPAPKQKKGPSVLDQIVEWLRNNPEWLNEKGPRVQEELSKHGIRATTQYVNAARRAIQNESDA